MHLSKGLKASQFTHPIEYIVYRLLTLPGSNRVRLRAPLFVHARIGGPLRQVRFHWGLSAASILPLGEAVECNSPLYLQHSDFSTTWIPYLRLFTGCALLKFSVTGRDCPRVQKWEGKEEGFWVQLGTDFQ